jgi:hypothetical protein
MRKHINKDRLPMPKRQDLYIPFLVRHSSASLLDLRAWSAALEALTALVASVEVGAVVMAGFAVLWSLNNDFSGEWKL